MATSRFTIASIDRDEVLRYLGRTDQEVSGDLAARVDAQIEQCLAIARPRAVVRVFDVAPPVDAYAAQAGPRPGGASPTPVGDAGSQPRPATDADAPRILLSGTTLVLRGSDIAGHLEGARAVGVMAATVGAEVDRRLRLLAHTSPFDQVVFDACATALAERAADAAEAMLVSEAAGRGLFANWRYSPGYGDFGLEAQPDLLAALDAGRQAGISLTDSFLLVPTKSVTAVLGLFETPRPGRGTLCGKCRCFDFCTIRTTGRTCRG